MTPELIAIAHRSLSLRQSPFLKHYKHGKYQFRDGVAFSGSELPGPGFNYAACLGKCPPLEIVAQMGREFFTHAESGWGILVEGGAGHPMEEELITAGWKVDEDEPAFVLTPLNSFPSVTKVGFQIRQVQNEADRKQFSQISTIAFDAPPGFADLIMPSLDFAIDPEMAWFIGEWNGTPVTCGGFYQSGDTAVVCCLATLPDHRQKGLGEIMTKHILNQAVIRGCTKASLRSGPKSIPLYERVGFRYICQHRTYAAPKNETTA